MGKKGLRSHTGCAICIWVFPRLRVGICVLSYKQQPVPTVAGKTAWHTMKQSDFVIITHVSYNFSCS